MQCSDDVQPDGDAGAGHVIQKEMEVPGSYPDALSSEIPAAMVHNLVGTCEIMCSQMPIDLNFVYKCLPNSFYDRRRFAAITIRVTEPICTGLLFTSGKLVVTGCKTFMQCVYAALRIVRMLSYYVRGCSFIVANSQIQNVVAHVVVPMQVHQRLNVDRLYQDHCCSCTYQKHLFPGLIFRPQHSPVVLLCFYSGKIVITGGKGEHEIHSGWARLWTIIRQYIE